jgi:uncharacterized protein YbjT (DUF2867 family)
MGSQVIVPYRCDEHDTRHLKVMGDYGQIVMVPFHLKETDSIQHVVQHANVVVNLVGQQWPSFNFTLEQANVEGVREIALAAKKAGAERFIHVSCMSADAESKSPYARSKAAGEAVVREIFPDATILRPGSMFGEEDRFLARIASQVSGNFLRVFPLVNGGAAKRTPIYVNDVAEAIGICVRDSNTAGKTYDLGGPSEYTQGEVYQMIFDSIVRHPFVFPAPAALMAMNGRFMQYLPGNPMSEDEVHLAFEDEVIGENALTAQDLGMAPISMDDMISKILLRFKPASISAKDAGVLL